MKLLFVSILISYSLFACHAKPFASLDESRAILPTEIDPFMGPPGPYWQPTIDQVRKFEAALEQHLNKIDQSEIAENLRDYRFQYLGYGSTKTRIALNAFCKHSWREFPKWQNTWVSVLDGGSCFFEASFDTSTMEIMQLQFNGSP